MPSQSAWSTFCFLGSTDSCSISEFWSSRKHASLKKVIVTYPVKGLDLCASVLRRIIHGRHTTRVQWNLPSKCHFLRFHYKQAHLHCATSFRNDVAKELLSWKGILINSILVGLIHLKKKHTPLNVCSSVICAW